MADDETRGRQVDLSSLYPDLEEEKGDPSVDCSSLAAALSRTGLVQVVKHGLAPNQFSMLCRLTDDSPKMKNWLDLIYVLLIAEDEAEGRWRISIGKEYFLREQGGELELIAGWVILLSSLDIGWAAATVRQVVSEVANDMGFHYEVEEMPLPGGANRNAHNKYGRGASAGIELPEILRRAQGK